MGFKPKELAIVLEEAKQYTDSQRIAHTEKKVLTYDGNPDKFAGNLDKGIILAKVADKPIALETVKKGIFTFFYGSPITLEEVNEENSRIVDMGIVRVLMVTVLGNEVPVVVIGEEIGTAVTVFELPGLEGYVSYVEFETVHQIDKKFIPGVVLPVVKLTTLYPESGTVELTAEENAQLDAVANSKTPVIIEFAEEQSQIMKQVTVFNTVIYNDPDSPMDGKVFGYMNFGPAKYTIYNLALQGGSGWAFVVEET